MAVATGQSLPNAFVSCAPTRVYQREVRLPRDAGNVDANAGRAAAAASSLSFTQAKMTAMCAAAAGVVASRSKTVVKRKARLSSDDAVGRRSVLSGTACTLSGAPLVASADVRGAAAETSPATVDSPAVFAVANNEATLMESGFKWDSKLMDNDVILLGEHHNSLADHQMQKRIVERLYKGTRGKRPMAVGMEMVQQRFQPVLDQYVAGKLTDAELYKNTEWEKRWSWPFEPSVPIFNYCRDNKIRMVALNTDGEALAKVERGGLEAMDQQDWAQFVPDRKGFSGMMANPEFKTYLNRVVIPSYYMHKQMGILKMTVTGQTLEKDMTMNHFVAGRLLWDETMAGRAVQYLDSAEGRGGLMCVLVGGDHVKYRYGLRARMERLYTQSGSKLRATSVMINPGDGDLLASSGPVMATLADGSTSMIPFADYVFSADAV